MPAVTVFQQGQKYIARCTYADRAIPKQAGFWWDPANKYWYTWQPEIAARLAVTPEQQERILLDAEAKEAVTLEKIALSKAQDSELSLPVPDGLNYLPYQRAGIACALDRTNVLFGDDMGLGKTIQAIGVLNTDQTLKRVLVICPASLLYNWYREMQKWRISGSLIGIATSKHWPQTEVVIINYDILKPHLFRLKSHEWDCVIIDEAHYLKNPKAQRTVNVVGKPANLQKHEEAVPGIRGRRILALTGTPIPNKPIEIWPLIHFLDPITWKSKRWFVNQFCGGSQDGASKLDQLQDRLRSTVMIRRRKQDVLKDLPEKRRLLVELSAEGLEDLLEEENIAWEKQEKEIDDLRLNVELSKAESQEKYEIAVALLRDRTQAAFSEISRIRHLTALAKLPGVMDHMMAALDGDETHKVVMFAHHKDVVAGILDRAKERQIKAVSITGETKITDRQMNVDIFQNEPECRLFVGNIKAAGVGITLTAADHVMFSELDWVPGNVTQAEDRCHRIGQKNSVTVEHLVLDGSLDAKMAKTLIDKQYVIDAALDNERPALAASVVTPSKDKPVTENMTVDKLAKIAEKLGRSTIELLHQGLKILSGMDLDHASSINEIGFSKLDVRIGHSLADRFVLTPKQGAIAAKLCNKYRRQLPENIADAAKAALQ